MTSERHEFACARFKFSLREPLMYGANEAGLEDNPEWPRFVRITDVDGAGNLKPETFKSLDPKLADGFTLEAGDVLLARSGATVGKAFLYSDSWGPACFAGYLIRARLNLSRYLPRFVFYFFQSSFYWDQVREGAIQATIQNFSAEKFGDLNVPIVTLADQRRIAAYLDAETRQMDALVAEKEAMLKLLEEKRAAQISHAVTRGLNPRAPLKPSALPWLGDIPKHWEVRRCANLFQETDVRDEPELPLLLVSINTGVTLRVFSDDRIESTAEDFNSYKVARQGQLAFNKMRFWQGAAGIAPVDGLVSPDYTVATVGPELDPQWIEHLFRLPLFSSEVRRHSHGIVDDRLRLYWEGFRDIRIPVPPLEEQRAIVAHLAAERERTAGLEAALRESIQLLQERRRALITAAVTGQIAI